MNGENNSRLIRPNMTPVETTYVDGPLAMPVSTVLQTPTKIKVLIIGGLTKVEVAAAMIAGSLAVDDELTGEAAADLSVALAEIVLVRCKTRRQEQESK